MNAKLSKVNQSIEKTIQIVEVMARGKGPMRLQDVAKKCGMPASTVMRMLNTLQVVRLCQSGSLYAALLSVAAVCPPGLPGQ